MGRDGLAPLWRDRGFIHRGPICWLKDRADQGRYINLQCMMSTGMGMGIDKGCRAWA